MRVRVRVLVLPASSLAVSRVSFSVLGLLGVAAWRVIVIIRAAWGALARATWWTTLQYIGVGSVAPCLALHVLQRRLQQ